MGVFLFVCFCFAFLGKKLISKFGFHSPLFTLYWPTDRICTILVVSITSLGKNCFSQEIFNKHFIGHSSDDLLVWLTSTFPEVILKTSVAVLSSKANMEMEELV